MAATTLTDARVRALRPRKTARDVRDGKLKGFGVRVLPSGRKRFFVHCQHDGKRVWKIVGDAAETGVDEARARARGMLAAIRRGEGGSGAGETLFEDFAETVFLQYERLWKRATLAVNRRYLKSQILPHFAGRRSPKSTAAKCMTGSPRSAPTPVSADRSMPVLSVIMREAEVAGLRSEGSNPCRGIRRYRRKGRERFLSDEEIRRLSARLTAHQERFPRQTAAIRLLLLTGCRKGEVLGLRWTDYREGHLFLRDSKSGPRTVWLSQAARDVLDDLDRAGPWVFGAIRAPRRTGSPRPGAIDRFWRRLRAEAGLADVRLHDLRHTHASIALRQGVTVLAIGRLLGHASPETTLKYTHLADSMVADAAEIVGKALGE